MLQKSSFKVTFFTDLHHADKEHGDFNCFKSLEKFERIIKDTEGCDYYVSLGDIVDYLDGTTRLFEEVVRFAEDRGLSTYRQGNYTKNTLFNVLGNHETAFIEKEKLSKFIPYKKGVGSVYYFKIDGVLFVVIDANYDRTTGVDKCEIMQSSTTFTIPNSQIEWVEEILTREIDEEIKSIVWISHIAYKDIDSKSRENMARAFFKRGLPVCVFEGHTHVEKFYTEVVDGKSLNIYTLAPVTFEFTIPNDQRASSYFYYQVVFSDGKMKSIESIRKKL